MTISKELFLAILSMDSYNRGYAAGVGGLSSAKDTAIGTATIQRTSGDSPAALAAAKAAGFYAISYTVGAGVTGIDPGTTVISYRGTDVPSFSSDPNAGASDILTGWVSSLGVPTSQVRLAIDFYTQVTGKQITDGAQSNVILTGHSLGGGLAGIVSAISHTPGTGYDHMPFGAVVSVLAAEYGVLPQLSQFNGIYTTGEALQFARNGSAQLFVGNLLSKLLGFGLALSADAGSDLQGRTC